MDRHSLVLLLLLLGVAPLQIFITYVTAPATGTGYGGSRAIWDEGLVPMRRLSEAAATVTEWFSRPAVRLHKYWDRLTAPRLPMCPAVEVERFNFYGLSLAPRTSRPSDVRFRIGQRVQFAKREAVVIGWDARPRGDAVFLETLSQNERGEPHYRIATQSANTPDLAEIYVAQSRLKVSEATAFSAQDLAKYFERYNARMGIWTPLQALRRLYPADQG